MAAEKQADIIIVGAGLAGLVAATEACAAGKRVFLVDQENAASLGGQAFWSLGGLFLVNSPEQRHLGVHDSNELALQDWMNTAGFDRPEDYWPRQWAQAYVDFAATEKRAWLKSHDIHFFPLVGWAERGGYLANGPGNSVPRFHIVRGSGPGVIAPFIQQAQNAVEKGLLQFCYRHRVTELIVTAGAVTGVRGVLLEPSATERGVPSSRKIIGEFELHGQAVIVTSGGIGANHELVRQCWPERVGKPPTHLLSGVPDYVDGSMLPVATQAGASLINTDRMWHYPEGLQNYAPIWSKHAIRILSGPSPLWLDAHGQRLPIPLFPCFDTLGALRHICQSGQDYSWFILNKRIINREFALSGSEQNPDLTSKSLFSPLRRLLPGAPNPVKTFVDAGLDFVVHNSIAGLAVGMNQLTGNDLIKPGDLQQEINARDQQVLCGLGKDAQIMAIHAARRYIGDKYFRVAAVAPLVKPQDGPLIAVRLAILTRKTLGGLQTNLAGQVLQANGEPLPGLYAAGEVCGFGGGGMHGYRALEGTFLGGCLFSGRTAARAAAAATL